MFTTRQKKTNGTVHHNSQPRYARFVVVGTVSRIQSYQSLKILPFFFNIGVFN